MRSGELVYTGVRRTPLCALLGWEVMAELFATTLDAYLLLGKIPPTPTDYDTADGRPADIVHARARLARILGEERDFVSTETLLGLARRVARTQQEHIVGQLQRVSDGRLPSAAIVAGSGEFLAQSVAAQAGVTAIVSLRERLGPETSAAACAYAVAALAAERGPV
jgi:uncharacterized hydantoinase/oxoprolinase family protein